MPVHLLAALRLLLASARTHIRPLRESGTEGRASLAAKRSGLGLGAGARAFLACAFLAGRGPVLGVLSEFPHEEVALQPGNMIDEQDAIQMIDLMLQASRQNAVRLDLSRVAIAIEVTGAHAGRPLDILENVRDRQTALLAGGMLVRSPENFRISETKRLRRRCFTFAFGHVENDHPLLHGDLNRGKPDARRGIHGLKHVVHERADAVVDRGHWRANEAQTRIGKGDDGP